jgi:hypothetical protein
MYDVTPLGTIKVAAITAVYSPYSSIEATGIIDNNTVIQVLDQEGEDFPSFFAPRQKYWTLEGRFQGELLIQEQIKVLNYLSIDRRLTQESNPFKTKVMAGLSYQELEQEYNGDWTHFDSDSFVEVNLVVVKVDGIEDLFSYYATSAQYNIVEQDVNADSGSFVEQLVMAHGMDRIEFVMNIHSHPHAFHPDFASHSVAGQSLVPGFMAAATHHDFDAYKKFRNRYFPDLPRYRHLEFAAAFNEQPGDKIILSEYGYNIDWGTFSHPTFEHWDW